MLRMLVLWREYIDPRKSINQWRTIGCKAAAAGTCHHRLSRFDRLANQLASYLTLSLCTHHIDVQ